MADSDGKDKRGRCEKIGDGFSNFGNFLYRREDNGRVTVMGRTGESWAKIGVFYVIFYGFLAGFFTAMLTVFLTTLNEPGKGPPKLIQFLANKPGLTYKYLDLNYNHSNPNVTAAYAKEIDALLGNYEKFATLDCDVTNTKGMPADTPCRFPKSELGECGTKGTNDYGLKDQTPCVYVSVNKVYGWVPTGPASNRNYLVLKCDPGVTVIPAGFLIAAFPFRGQPAFQNPVVAVKFNVTKIKKFECYLQGENIEVSDSSLPHRAFSKIRIP